MNTQDDQENETLIALPTVVNQAAADALKQAIVARQGAPVLVDAANVRMLGALGLEVLLCAACDARTRGQQFAILNQTIEFDACLKLLGVGPDNFIQGAPA